MKKILNLFLVIALLMIVFAGCSPKKSEQSSSKETEKPIVLKLGTNVPGDNPENVFARRVAELVAEKTDGMVTIEVYDSSQLGKNRERLEGLRMGTIDMTQTSIDYLAAYEPAFALFGGPYLYVDEKHQNRAWNGPLKDYVNKIIGAYGYVLVQAMEMGARHITNNVRPIETLADLKGLKLRVPDTEGSIDTFTYLGASPTPMAFSELYMALSQKVVDGQENPMPTAYSAKFYEVQKYLSLTGHQRIEQALLFSKMNWEKLPEKYRNTILESSVIANEELIELFVQLNADLVGKFEAEGVKVNEVKDINEFINAVAPFRDAYIKKFGDSAQKIYDLIDTAK